MKAYTFTVDDNIRCLKELTYSSAESIFSHPYLALYKRLHSKYQTKIQLNLFYQCNGFTLSDMTDRFRDEWQENSDWLKLSFHSKEENVNPYKNSGYDEVYQDCRAVNSEILRFAGKDSLAKTTTVHFCTLTTDGVKAIKDCGVKGLLGLYGEGRKSYSLSDSECEKLNLGEKLICNDIVHLPIDIVLNRFEISEIIKKLDSLKSRSTIEVMIHEQYFYPDYPLYQPHFEEKLEKTFEFLKNNNYESKFMEELL